MAKPKAIKTAAVAVAVPQDHDQVVHFIAEIGQRQRERVRIEAVMNDELAAIRQKWEAEALPHAERIRALSQGVHVWCEANRARLTQGGKVKHFQFASGEVKWRLPPPSVVLRGVEVVLQHLKALRLDRFIRLKEEVNKEAILLEPEQVRNIPGITIRQEEQFVVSPFETELEEVA